VLQREVPQPTAVASPVVLMEATSLSLETQPWKSGFPARFSAVGGALYVPMAMNCAVSPILFRVWVPGMSVIPTRARSAETPMVTVSVAVPVTKPNDEDMVAVIVVVPPLRGVASPVELMVATAGLLDAHVTESVMSVVWVGCEVLV
jgi:hypothetical protein